MGGLDGAVVVLADLLSATLVLFDVCRESFNDGDNALVLLFSCALLALEGRTWGLGTFVSTCPNRPSRKSSSAFVLTGYDH